MDGTERAVGRFLRPDGLAGGGRFDGRRDITPTLANEQPYEQIELRLTTRRLRGRNMSPIMVTGGIRDIYQASATYERILGHLAGTLCGQREALRRPRCPRTSICHS